MVAVDHTPRIKDVASIQIDDTSRGGRLAAQHLVALGHKRFAFVGCPARGGSILEPEARASSTTSWSKGSGRRSAKKVVCDALDFFEGHARSLELFRHNRDVTAIFCANDEVAAGVLRAAREEGRSVPRDVSVVGFDDIIMSNYTDPPLTTISTDKVQMGRRATTRLIEFVEGTRTDTSEDVMPVDLVERSCGVASTWLWYVGP